MSNKNKQRPHPKLRKDAGAFLSNLHYAFARTDGSYDLPNSLVGDLLREAKAEIERHEDGIERLRRAIKAADAEHRNACMNLGTSAQVGAQSRLDQLRFAFALVTNTSVGGPEFNKLLGLDNPVETHPSH